ncbi:anti-CBASS protein Acb1 family protein [Xenorhabdus bovienii]|uniref:anti-CBASS protein Acb1 family protein n=1 Tax=Xenorhabdus bovienii TaxID=40576 RepID=UPI0023B2800C|nr:anti-CBASS Acb1 family protein [Xenorhabdus bovienii]MDE9456102.1 DUF1073 domain-containing protein [Xenorhabdus bovienii]
MNLESLPKYFSPKTAMFSDSPAATATDSFSITDVMASLGLASAQAQLLYDYVIHFQDSRTSAARLLEKFSFTVLKTNMSDILTNPNSTQSLDGRLAYMASVRSNDGIVAIDKEMEDIVKLETPLSGVTDIVRQMLELIVVINRTPAVALII